MPKANTPSKTLARLAMGTALLTVMAGCENRAATGYKDFVNLPAPTVAPLPALIPETATVVAPEYVAPGAPTYSEPTQAANIQTFETVYGQPVADLASGTLIAETPYTPPSYNDGSVMVQSLPAIALDVATYSETITATPYTPQPIPMAETASYSVAADVTDGLVYGEDFTSSSYAVTTEPFDPLPTASASEYTVVESTAVENYTVEPLPVMVESYTAEPMPVMSETMTTFDTLPTTTATAVSEPMPIDAGTLPPEVAAVFGNDYSNGVQIIGNEEAVTTYEVMPAIAEPSIVGDQSALTSLDATIMETSVEPLGFEVMTVAELPIETMPLPTPSPRIEASPEPRQKAYVTAAVARTVEPSPLTAPLPRRRPAVTANEYANFFTPLPQPRPEYREPMAVATTAGKYVSVGSIAEWQDDAKAVTAEAPEEPAVQEASITTEEPLPSVLEYEQKPSALSGTSWKLAALGEEAIDVSAELHFDDSSAFAGGQGPCNSYGGEFINAGEGRFSMANIFATELACPSLEVESAYIDALKMADQYRIASDFSEMVLLDDAGQAVARFTAF